MLLLVMIFTIKRSFLFVKDDCLTQYVSIDKYTYIISWFIPKPRSIVLSIDSPWKLYFKKRKFKINIRKHPSCSDRTNK